MSEELRKRGQDAIQGYNKKYPHATRLVRTKRTFNDRERGQLIQQGNKCLNENKLDQARKIFEAIDYYDGLLRLARNYAEKGNMLGAYKLFHQLQAKEHEVLGKQITETLQKWLLDS